MLVESTVGFIKMIADLLEKEVNERLGKRY